MTLVGLIGNLAARIGTEFKTVRAEMAALGSATSDVNSIMRRNNVGETRVGRIYTENVTPNSIDELASKTYVDALGTANTNVNSIVRRDSGGGFGANYIFGIGAPVNSDNAAPKSYVDTGLAGKITSFADPNADRIVFWDDSASAYVALSVTAPLTITGTAMAVSAATTGAAGSVQLATQAVVNAGSNAVQPVTPSTLRVLMSSAVQVLTDAATIAVAVNAALTYRVTIAASRTIGVPTGAVDGQRILLQVTASGGDWTLTLSTGTAGSFKFGTDIIAIPTIINGTTTFIGCVYRTASSRWHVLAVSSGH
jgi:hypothetical protein